MSCSCGSSCNCSSSCKCSKKYPDLEEKSTAAQATVVLGITPENKAAAAEFKAAAESGGPNSCNCVGCKCSPCEC